jgi:DNA-binding NarL/FixJ family response regulator
MQPTDKTQLTTHEREILALLARGLTNKQIGYMLSISAKTVANELSGHQEGLIGIYPKLGLTGATKRVRAARWWLEHGSKELA